MRKMNMDRLQTPFIIFILLLFLAGCGSLTGTSNTPQNFRQGTEGIAVSFMPTIPKEIVVTQNTDEKISFFIQLKNKGAYPGEGQSMDGSLWLSGFDSAIISPEGAFETPEPFTSTANGNLRGRTSTNTVGGTTTHEFKAIIRTNDQIPSLGKYSPTVLANVCYFYQTIANPVVCVEKDAFSLSTQKKACIVGDVTLTSQGAPIAVTKVEAISTTDRMQFKITAKNVGKGSAIDTSVSCSPSAVRGVQRHQLDIITLSSVKISDQDLVCNAPEQKVRLIDGTGFFTCTLDKIKLLQQQAAFTTPLDITLSYLYKETAEKPITINNIPS